jgi:hypothetical protein
MSAPNPVPCSIPAAQARIERDAAAEAVERAHAWLAGIAAAVAAQEANGPDRDANLNLAGQLAALIAVSDNLPNVAGDLGQPDAALRGVTVAAHVLTLLIAAFNSADAAYRDALSTAERAAAAVH